ncbi:hypothetical protein EHI45_30840 [Rhizobium leguminosarum]|uniref:ribbon-helix-helix protein n=1 Tax=Rhizobium leguminosarum TaxID=384 RepID=UPI000FEC61B3|nr:hypothetical protein [Rhizobium leguminosarum]RWX04946.1 hypothetical protein EHI45_30840 [Rhizobium leguminosarum]
MTATPPKRGFATRPGDAENWIKAADAPAARMSDAAIYSARLTIDVTPDQRARIKIAAFQRGVTMADMLRELLAREFPESSGDAT